MEANAKTEKEIRQRMVRILSTDIEGNMRIYPALTKIKGVSWSFSNAVCKSLNIDKNKKIGSFSQDEIKKISDFIQKFEVPSFVLNRKRDRETGEDIHVVGTNLELKKDFDIKRLRQIKSYKGFRHYLNLPVRGQRTKSNFRKNRRKGAGIKKKKK